MKTFVEKYGFPTSRIEIEHEEGECASCKTIGNLNFGDVVFVVENSQTDKQFIRKIVGIGFLDGILCKKVTEEDAKREIETAKRKGLYVKDKFEQ